MRFPAPLTVIASRAHVDTLRDAAPASLIGDASLFALELHQEVTAAHLTGAGIAVVEVDPRVPSSMRRIERVRGLRPGLPLIVALENTDLGLVRTLVREGVDDVVALPLAPEELMQATIAVLEVRASREEPQTALAPLVAVTRALGGGGATTLITNLAARFAADGARVCLFDLDIQVGRASEVLELQTRRTLADLLEGGQRIDGDFLASVVAEHPSGLAVVAAPADIVPLESIDVDQLRRVLALARREYDYVFIDVPAALTNWSLSILADTDHIVLVVEQSLASLRQAKRRLELFRNVGIGTAKVSIVVNRIEKRLFGSIGLADVEAALGHEVLVGLRADAQNIALAQDQGLLVGDVRRKSPYVLDVDKLADVLRPLLVREDRP